MWSIIETLELFLLLCKSSHFASNTPNTIPISFFLIPLLFYDTSGVWSPTCKGKFKLKDLVKTQMSTINHWATLSQLNTLSDSQRSSVKLDHEPASHRNTRRRELIYTSASEFQTYQYLCVGTESSGFPQSNFPLSEV